MSDSEGPSLAGRALVAVVLMAGFYVMALAIAGVLLFIPYAEWHWAHRIHVKLVLACVLGAGVLLWSILPRRDRFVPPGPRLDRARHPELFQELERISAATGQEVPEEAYLEYEVNAWVSQRGGLMGWGGRRVMAVGLPLLRVLTVSQLRGVLGHEFGHYHGGDTRLGPWIYKTREALFRTLRALGSNESWLRYPFIGYAKIFFRVSGAISRRQELAADRLAAKIVGSRIFGGALRVVEEAGLAYRPYLDSELFPVLNLGHRPPVAEGFARFLASPRVASQVQELVQKRMKSPASDPYQTHPPLPERLAAISELPSSGSEPADDRPAIALLGDIDRLELELLLSVTGNDKVRGLKPVAWEDMPQQALVPAWRERVKGASAALSGVSPSAFPELTPKRLEEIGQAISKEKRLAPADAQALARSTLSAALALQMVDAGWTLRSEPGEDVVVARGKDEVDTFSVFSRLDQGQLTAEEWRARLRELGVDAIDLGRPTPG
jgi:Zn-dependent protease with chaperone function